MREKGVFIRVHDHLCLSCTTSVDMELAFGLLGLIWGSPALFLSDLHWVFDCSLPTGGQSKRDLQTDSSWMRTRTDLSSWSYLGPVAPATLSTLCEWWTISAFGHWTLTSTCVAVLRLVKASNYSFPSRYFVFLRFKTSFQNDEMTWTHIFSWLQFPARSSHIVTMLPSLPTRLIRFTFYKIVMGELLIIFDMVNCFYATEWDCVVQHGLSPHFLYAGGVLTLLLSQ